MRTRDLEAALKLTPLFYDAALAPERWPAVLKLLCNEFGAATANFANYNFDAEGGAVVGAYSWPVDAPLLPRYLAFENLAAGDPRRAPGMRLPNRPLYRTQLVEDADWYGSLIYRQVYAPLGLDDTLGVYLVNETSRLALGLGFAREIGATRFDEQDAERLQLYIPHLRCATRVMTERIAETATASSLVGVLDQIDLAIVITDPLAEIRFANRAANRLLRAASGVRRAGRKLAALEPETNRRLREAIFVHATHPERTERSNVTVPREGIGLQVTICAPAAGLNDGGEVFGGPRAAIFLNDPLKSYESRTEQLQRLFGLTLAEAEIARRYAETSDLRTIAAEAGRSYETVRSHLKQVMQKVEVNRQADLVRVLVASAPPLRPLRLGDPRGQEL